VNPEQEKTSKQWISDAEGALNRTGDALRTAWNETKESRMATLQAAREAASRLARAIDEGIDAARRSWDSTPHEDREYVASADTEPEPSPGVLEEEE
jgi:hypothetical protein